MTPKITEAIEALVEALREESPEQMTTFRLFVNCEERIVETSERTPEQLKRAGISMRNLRGNFISENSMSAHTDNERSEAAVDVPRLVREIELMGEVVDAAKCIRHWHDSGEEGMVVSKEHVFKLWQALNNLEANAAGELQPPAEQPKVNNMQNDSKQTESAGAVSSTRLLGFGDALRIARGCLDYGGGHRSDEGHLEIYHHGIQTVINALEAAEKNGLADTQCTALWRMGHEKPNSQARPPQAG